MFTAAPRPVITPHDNSDAASSGIAAGMLAIWLWSTTIGGGQQEAIIVPHADFASFDRDEMSFAQFLADKLGSAEAAGEMMREFANTTESTDFQIWVHEQNLSMGSGD